MSVSQNEIERTSERTKIGLASAIESSHIPHIAPLGYKHKDKRLIIDYSPKDIIIRIFDLYYNGLSYKKISNLFIAELIEYDEVVNQFFFPMIKQKFDGPKEQLEKEINNQRNKLERIKKHISMEFLN